MANLRSLVLAAAWTFGTGFLPVNVAQTRGLTTQIDAPTQLTGAYNSFGSECQFDAISPESHVAQSTVVMSGKVFESLWDGESGRFVVDGHDNALTEEDKLVLAELRTELETPYVDGKDESTFEGFPLHVGVLLGQLHWLSVQTPAKAIGRYLRPAPSSADDPADSSAGELRDGNRGYSWGIDLEWVWWQLRWLPACARRGTWRTAYICPNGRCNQIRAAWVNGTGGTTRPCGGSNRWNLGGNTCGDWTCQGQCGIGCQAWWHNGTYVDCFEHDVCTDWFPDASCNLDRVFAAWAFSDSYVNGRCR